MPVHDHSQAIRLACGTPTVRHAQAWAKYDRKYRRCAEHNCARYWCGCYYADALAAEEPRRG